MQNYKNKKQNQDKDRPFYCSSKKIWEWIGVLRLFDSEKSKIKFYDNFYDCSETTVFFYNYTVLMLYSINDDEANTKKCKKSESIPGMYYDNIHQFP